MRFWMRPLPWPKRPIGYAVVLLALAAVTACATGGGSDRGSSPGGRSRSGGGGFEGGGRSNGGGGSASVSARRATLVQSLSNNKLTSYTVSTGKAGQEAAQLQSNAKNKRALEGRLSALRLAKRDMGQILETAQRIATLEMKRNPDSQVDDDVKLEIALGAMNSGKYSLARYFLEQLYDSKNARVKAGAINATGVMALRDDRVPEAVSKFEKALSIVRSYKPAHLNLGFIALKGGDLKTAKKHFSAVQNDWFVQYGLISINRMEGNYRQVEQMCERVLGKNPKHKAALFNCGLYHFQVKNNYEKAKQLMNKAARAPGGAPGWDDKAYRMVTKVNFAQSSARKKKKAAQKKAAQQRKARQKSQSGRSGSGGGGGSSKAGGRGR